MKKMSRSLKRQVRDNIRAKLLLIKRGQRRLICDSAYLSFLKDDVYINELANRAIRMYDRRHRDLIAAGVVLFKILLIKVCLPLLINLIKSKVLEVISETVKAKIRSMAMSVVDDIISIKNKGDNETYLTSTAKAIAMKFKKLMDILKAEVSGNASKLKNTALYGIFLKLSNVFNKSKTLVKA